MNKRIAELEAECERLRDGESRELLDMRAAMSDAIAEGNRLRARVAELESESERLGTAVRAHQEHAKYWSGVVDTQSARTNELVKKAVVEEQALFAARAVVEAAVAWHHAHSSARVELLSEAAVKLRNVAANYDSMSSVTKQSKGNTNVRSDELRPTSCRCGA